MHLAMAVGFANHRVCDELEFCDGDFTSTKWECTLLFMGDCAVRIHFCVPRAFEGLRYHYKARG